MTINGNDNWGEIPFFPAFDLSPKGLATALYKMEYSRPTMVGYKIDSIDRKRDYTEIKLSKLKDRIVDLKIRLAIRFMMYKTPFKHFSLSEIWRSFGKSDYFVDWVMPKILKGTKSENLPREEKQRLMNSVGNDVNSLKVFKQKLYLGLEFKDTSNFNSNLVNEVERAARTIRKYLPEMKKKLGVVTSFDEFEGVKIETTLRYSNFSAAPFLSDTSPDFDSFEFYVPIDALKLFDEAEITDQDLVDKSFVMLNSNRIRVNLSQFSN